MLDMTKKRHIFILKYNLSCFLSYPGMSCCLIVAYKVFLIKKSGYVMMITKHKIDKLLSVDAILVILIALTFSFSHKALLLILLLTSKLIKKC